MSPCLTKLMGDHREPRLTKAALARKVANLLRMDVDQVNLNPRDRLQLAKHVKLIVICVNFIPCAVD